MYAETYSRRLLSPFHGLQQVIAMSGGIAESINGWDWKLYVADETIVSHTGLSEIVYGSWNPISGLSRSRIRGAMSSSLIEMIGDELLHAVEQVGEDVPFPSLDHHELWLLDKTHGLPLALLDSALDTDARLPNDYPTWHPGGQADKQFCAQSGNAELLSRLVKNEAGRHSRAIWITRHPDGTGNDDQGNRYAVTDFPILLLREHWNEMSQQQLVTDFLAWQAPWLLQLPLCQKKRIQLENAAWSRPLETSQVYRLFPEIIDEQGLTTARVRARIMQDKPVKLALNEPFYPFVNE